MSDELIEALRKFKKRDVDTFPGVVVSVDKEKGTWFAFLPTTSTFGEVGCKIEHDQSAVISSGMDGV